ncbi:MAG: DedA family protein [Patescibacteria group bacterium]|nr:DedA family protein [bacterium]MDZ4227459.1 DedA family protein [Patescibacteria group bacterium]
MSFIELAPVVKLIGYPGLFAAVFLESGVFFGFFLPGASLLFTSGLLASNGYFNIWILIPLLTIAAILGDNVGYWFGNKVGIRLFLRPNSRFFKHEHLEAAKEFYDKHGALAIFLARFVPIVRTFAPIVAGIVEMRYRVFIVYNIAGAMVWGAGVTFLGYYLGERFPLVERYFLLVILLIVIVTTLPIFWHAYKRMPAKEV